LFLTTTGPGNSSARKKLTEQLQMEFREPPVRTAAEAENKAMGNKLC
jgi:hypothetical protein